MIRTPLDHLAQSESFESVESELENFGQLRSLRSGASKVSDSFVVLICTVSTCSGDSGVNTDVRFRSPE